MIIKLPGTTTEVDLDNPPANLEWLVRDAYRQTQEQTLHPKMDASEQLFYIDRLRQVLHKRPPRDVVQATLQECQGYTGKYGDIPAGLKVGDLEELVIRAGLGFYTSVNADRNNTVLRIIRTISNI